MQMVVKIYRVLRQLFDPPRKEKDLELFLEEMLRYGADFSSCRYKLLDCKLPSKEVRIRFDLPGGEKKEETVGGYPTNWDLIAYVRRRRSEERLYQPDGLVMIL